jgi:hypothetical protein
VSSYPAHEEQALAEVPYANLLRSPFLPAHDILGF